jgi:hypothetical protein
MPEPGDTVTVETVPEDDPFTEDEDQHLAELTVKSLTRRVPDWVRLAPTRHVEAAR